MITTYSPGVCRIISLILLGFLLILQAQGQVSYQLSKPTQNVLLFTSDEPGVGNCTAIIGNDGIVVIDASYSPSSAAAIIDLIASITDLPIRYLVNTHWHDDHVWGNQSFKSAFPNLTILSHSHTRKSIIDQAIPSLQATISAITTKVAQRDSILESGMENGKAIDQERQDFLAGRQKLFRSTLKDYQGIRPVLPDLIFRDSLSLVVGTQTVAIKHLGWGHTKGDLVVYLPQDRVVILGDLVTCPIPAGTTVPIDHQINTLKKVLELDADIWIPGHGDVMYDTTYIRLYLDLLISLQEIVKEAKDDELSMEECLSLIRDKGIGEAFTQQDPRLAFAFKNFFLKVTLGPLFEE